MRTYLQHGTRQAPWGTDPSVTAIWRYVGTDPQVPFLAGANMAPTAAIPNPVPLRFRLAVGPPNVCEYQAPWPDVTSGDFPVATSIVSYTKHQIEIQGDVTDVVTGDTVFVLPLEYQHDHDVPCHAHDDSGNYVACRLLSTGEFIYGVP